jgi:MFS family permease
MGHHADIRQLLHKYIRVIRCVPVWLRPRSHVRNHNVRRPEPFRTRANLIAHRRGVYFKHYFNQPSAAELGTMVAILEVGAFVSSLVVGRIGDVLGRRRTILYGSLIFIVGGALQAFANGMPMMLLGRIIAGLGVGTLSTIVPVYQSEISPAHNRGRMGCIEFTGNVSGYAASVWVDYFCSYIKNDWAWRVPLFMQIVMGCLLAGGSLLICESPRFVPV